MAIKKVGVLGCGLMGSGIAQVSATAGFDVISLEIEQKYIERGFAGIRKSLDKLAAKGKLGEPADAIFARLKGTTRKEDLADCDIIVEAIIENLARNARSSPPSTLSRSPRPFSRAIRLPSPLRRP